MNQNKLKSLLHYDPDTGVFTNLTYRSPGAQEGTIAGTLNPNGYRILCIEGRYYKEHRLAFLYMTGDWPPVGTDHINRIKNDNRWKNLRPAGQRVNSRNQSRRINNKSGVTGVNWHAGQKRWHARISGDFGRINIGSFDNLLDAVAARLRAERELGYHKNHGRNV